MSEFKGLGVHSQLKLFFDLMEMLYTGDIPSNSSVDLKLKQLGFSNETRTREIFESIIDQPAFMTADHKRLREMLIQWYASNRSLINRIRKTTDPFSLSYEPLNELIKSFGFPYPHKILSNKNRALFLLDLVNLYNKKGTPESIARALQYFGLMQVTISEWWIHRNAAGVYVARSQPILPRTARDTQTWEELGYNEFIARDPMWHLTYEELDQLYNDSLITLPSLTPHFSIDASVNIKQMYAALSIVSKLIQEQYDLWLDNGKLNQDIYADRVGHNISLLELCLSIGYVFANPFISEDDKMYQYQGRIDENYDGIPDYPFDQILEEYDRLHERTQSQEDRDKNREEFTEKFLGEKSEFFLKTVSDANDFLELINPSYKTKLDEDLAAAGEEVVLEALLQMLDGYLCETYDLLDFSISYLINGASTYKRLKPIIDFFKPLRARIREFLTAFLINDPLGDSQLEKDYLFLSLRQFIYDHWPGSDYLFTQIFQKLEDDLGCDKELLDQIVKDHLIKTGIVQIIRDMFSISDRMYLGQLSTMFVEKGPHELDWGLAKDNWIVIVPIPVHEPYHGVFDHPILKDHYNQGSTQNLVERGPFGASYGLAKDDFQIQVIDL